MMKYLLVILLLCTSFSIFAEELTREQEYCSAIAKNQEIQQSCSEAWRLAVVEQTALKSCSSKICKQIYIDIYLNQSRIDYTEGTQWCLKAANSNPLPCFMAYASKILYDNDSLKEELLITEDEKTVFDFVYRNL